MRKSGRAVACELEEYVVFIFAKSENQVYGIFDSCGSAFLLNWRAVQI